MAKEVKKKGKIITAIVGGTALVGGTVAGSTMTSVETEESEEEKKKMNIQVKKDFGFLDINNKTTITLNITIVRGTYDTSWISRQILRANLNDLLQVNNYDRTKSKAKTIESGDFLINELKITPVSGEGINRIFKRSDLQDISIVIKKCLPIMAKTSDNTDYAIIGGKIIICFKKNNHQIGDDFFLDILGQPNIGLFASALPNQHEISIKNFNEIPRFMPGQSNKNIKTGENIIQYLKLDSNIVKSIKTILLYSNQEVKIIVKKINAHHENFTQGDNLKVKIKVGEIEFPNEYTLTL